MKRDSFKEIILQTPKKYCFNLGKDINYFMQVAERQK